MDHSKDPSEELYGSRQFKVIMDEHDVTEGGRQVTKSSIYDTTHYHYDGHINRNIRACMALIDMAKPYITLVSYEESELLI